MPRNGSGTFNPDTILTPNTTAKASEVNDLGNDLGAEITNSVAADGQTTMTGPLKAANGSAAAPSITFGSDPDTGFFRIGPNSVGLSLGGVSQGSIINPTAFFTATPSTGTSDYVVGSTAPPGFTLVAGRRVTFPIGNTNTSVTNNLNVEGTGLKAIVKRATSGNVPLAIGDLVAGALADVIYDGTSYVLTENISQGFGPQVAITAAATTDLGTRNSRNVLVNGTTGITSLGSGAHVSAPLYLLKFAGILTMTNSAGLALVGGADITTAAGDYALAHYAGSGNWAVISYMRASGKALIETQQLPTQTSNAGKFLTTNGTVASWSGNGVSARGSFSGTSIVGGSFNMSAVSNPGAGIYDVSFSTAMANTNYQVLVAVEGGGTIGLFIIANVTTAGFRIQAYLANAVAQNFAKLQVTVFGGL